jgi:multiple sugar transport system ATP-binding protein
MNGGRVVQIGRPLDVYHAPADTFVAAFLGSPPANLLPARFNGNGLAIGEAALPLVRKTHLDEVIFGIRPEDIHVGSSACHARGEVVAVEPLGAETIVRFRLPGVPQDVLARGARTLNAKVGERIPLAFDLDAVHLFDPATTHRIA